MSTDLSIFRIYEPHELGDDGYPHAWHEADRADRGVKHLVRSDAGDRCERCGHPFVVGESGVTEGNTRLVFREAYENAFRGDQEAQQVLDIAGLDQITGSISAQRELIKGKAPAVNWSACDDHCLHDGPFRARDPEGGGWTIYGAEAPEAAERVRAGRQVEAAWRILTVHHLNGRKHDLRWWNLAALCQRCHLTIQRKVQMERVWPWEHSDWFKPHAAGWYAYAYLGENLTRAEALDREDELLGLERVA